MKGEIRQPAVAGRFYTDQPNHLEQEVKTYIEKAVCTEPLPAKAVIAPHAGYMFSGPIAGSSFRILEKRAGSIDKVVVIGPSHYVPFRGIAGTQAAAFATPLGAVPVDQEALARLEVSPGYHVLEEAHEQEHALEVELPFLQALLGEFELIPLVTGNASRGETAAILEQVWGGDETLIVVSSDLSHYLDYSSAQAIDAFTSEQIGKANPDPITGRHACGYIAIQGLLQVASAKGLKPCILDVRNSGDTAGPKDQVVGYGAYAFKS